MEVIDRLILGAGEVYIIREMTDIGLQITTFGSHAQAAGATIVAIALTKQYG